VKTKTCHSSWRSFLLQYVADYAAGIKCQSVRCRLPNCIMTLINLPSNPREKRFVAEFSAALQLQLLHVDTLVCLPGDGNRLTQRESSIYWAKANGAIKKKQSKLRTSCKCNWRWVSFGLGEEQPSTRLAKWTHHPEHATRNRGPTLRIVIIVIWKF